MKVFSDNTSAKLSNNSKFNLTKLNFINKLNEGTVRDPVQPQLTKQEIIEIRETNLTAALEAIQTQITNL